MTVPPVIHILSARSTQEVKIYLFKSCLFLSFFFNSKSNQVQSYWFYATELYLKNHNSLPSLSFKKIRFMKLVSNQITKKHTVT